MVVVKDRQRQAEKVIMGPKRESKKKRQVCSGSTVMQGIALRCEDHLRSKSSDSERYGGVCIFSLGSQSSERAFLTVRP